LKNIDHKKKRKQKKAVLLSSIFAYFHSLALICAYLRRVGLSGPFGLRNHDLPRFF
jgi:hypothetical protein